MKIAQNIGDLIGNTPIIKLNNIDRNLYGNIYAKCEFMNPTSSVKDRIGFNMIGNIDKNTHIIEATSGNTGIALASYCASLNIKLTLTMPESMSLERQKLLNIFGANLVLTPKELGMQGAIDKAIEINNSDKNSIILKQFENINNLNAHKKTANEILNDMDSKIDIFITSVGTGGTIMGISKYLKKEIEDIKIIAIEPKNSAVLSGELPSVHKIQGIGAGFIPKLVDRDIFNDIIRVSDEDALEYTKLVIKKEGLLVGISSGANLYGAIKLASLKENKDKNILTIFCDTGERYLSTELFN